MVVPSLAVASLIGVGLLALRRLRRVKPSSLPAVEGPNLLSLVAHLPGMAYRSGLERTVQFASQGALELTGYSAESFTSGQVTLSDLVHPDDAESLKAEISAAVNEGRPYQLMYRLYRRDGSERWVWERGTVTRHIHAASELLLEGFIADVTARKATEDRLLQEALHDSLTGLPNRTLLSERLEVVIRRSLRRPLPAFAVLFLDLDRFKMITDSLGRELGDQALRATARRLQACLRQEDTVARVGGDEFAILLEDIGHAGDVVRVAHRLCEVVGLPLYLQGEEVFTTCSIGIATSLSGYEHPEDALRDAEIGRASCRERV